MLITVITLTYKSEYCVLFKTIQSTLEQNYNMIELIIADDGTPGFDSEYVGKYIIENKKSNLINYSILKKNNNEGTVKNYKAATDVAKGDIIVNLSCGDYFYNRDVLTNISKHYEDKDCLFLSTRRLVCDSDEIPLFFWPHLLDKHVIKRLKTNKDQYLSFVTDKFYAFASGSSISFRKSILEKYPIDCNYRLLEDMPLFTKFTWDEMITYDHELVSIKYRMDGVSNSNNPVLYRDMLFYNENERIKNLNEFNRQKRRHILFIVDRYNSTNKFKKIQLILKYPLISLEWWLILRRDRLNAFIDKMYIMHTFR